MNYQHQPNPTRQRGITHDYRATSYSQTEAVHTISRQLEKIEAGIKTVEVDVLKFFQEVTG